MTRLRLCYVGPAASVTLRRWVEWFAARGHEATIVTVEPVGSAELQGVHQIDVGCPRGPRKIGRLVSALRMARVVSGLRADVVHVHYLRGLAWGLLCTRTRPWVLTPWGSDVLEEQGAFREWYSERLTKALLRRADLITVHSAYMERRLHALIGQSRSVCRIGWGVDLARFRPGLEVESLKRRWGIASHRPVVLSPRIAKPFYRHELVIRALPALRGEAPDVLLLITEHEADEAYLHSLKRLARDLGVEEQVRFIGAIAYEEMPRWYNLADVVVMTPRSDGLPNSLLETMACGTVPVLARMEQYDGLVRHGVNGLLVDADPSAIAEALATAIADEGLRRRIGEANQSVVKERGDQDQEMAKMEAWYHRLAASGSAATRRNQSAHVRHSGNL